MKLENNKLVHLGYKGIWYFQVFKGEIGVLLNPVSEYFIISGGIIYAYTHPKTALLVVLAGLLMFFVFMGLGTLIVKIGLYNTKRYVDATKDPITKEILDRLKHIESLL